MRKRFSKEIYKLQKRLDWCQAQSAETKLKLQSHNLSNSCQLCKDDKSFKSLCLKYEKEIADLKIENIDWQQNRDHIQYCNGLLESDI